MPTTSLNALLNRNGIPSVHYDRGGLGRTMQQNRMHGAPPLADYDQVYRAFANMECRHGEGCFEGYRHCRELVDAYESSEFILNTREREKRIRSLVIHTRRFCSNIEYADFYRKEFGSTEWEDFSEEWRQRWEEHHEKIRRQIPAGRLLVFDIERYGPALLCEFVGLPVEGAKHYKRENPSLNGFGWFVASCTPLVAKRAFQFSWKSRAKRMFRKF